MKRYYVYMLKCEDNSIYTGITNNLIKRLDEHNSSTNQKSYTFSKRPVILIFSQYYYNVMEAIAFEKKIKGWSRNKKLALANKNFDLLKSLSQNRMHGSSSSP